MKLITAVIFLGINTVIIASTMVCMYIYICLALYIYIHIYTHTFRYLESNSRQFSCLGAYSICVAFLDLNPEVPLKCHRMKEMNQGRHHERPISRDIAILSLRYPISRDTFFREVSKYTREMGTICPSDVLSPVL